jgi:pimeloyl-ACP methyl ester carboxylesterase
MDPGTFERQRLDLFARHGFDGAGRFVTDRAGRRTYLIERGEVGRPTVLIHGGLSEASEWSLVAGRLTGRVVMADRPGCGLSEAIDYRRVEFRRAAEDWVLDLLDHIGPDPVDLVGNSTGGFFAISFALAHPERVRRLVLVGAPAGLHEELPLFVRLWGNRFTGPLIARLRTDDPETFRTRVMATLLVAHAERVPVELLEVMVAAAAIPGVDRAARSFLQAVTTLRGWRRELMLREEITRLATPTTFLWGEADAFARPASGRRVWDRMPDARLLAVPDAGHLLQLDRPDIVTAAIAGADRLLARGAAGDDLGSVRLAAS